MNEPMAHDPLEQLLRRADSPAGDARNATDIAPAARRSLARRRYARGIGMAAAALAIALLLIPRNPGLPPVAQSQPQPWSPEQVAAARAEVEALRHDANASEQMVELLLAAEHQATARKQKPRAELLDPATELLLEQERAASILVQSGDRLAEDVSSQTRAQREYQRVLELFPNSSSAEQARRRLAQMNG
jgi:hypothetical protein